MSAGDFDLVATRSLASMRAIVTEYGGVSLNASGRGPCPIHGGDGPNFRAEDGEGWFCFSGCASGGDAVDFVRLTKYPHLDKRAGRVEALRELAPRVGVDLGPSRPLAVGRRAPRTDVPRPIPVVSAADARRAALASELEAMRVDGCVPQDPPAIYAALLAALPLSGSGAEYLECRGFDPERAYADGFRAIPGAAAWSELAALLAGSYVRAERELAGLHRGPWGGGGWKRQPPALVIPYRQGEAVRALRFRSLAPDAGHKDRYRDLAGVGAHPCPFNADALEQLAGHELHVVEGELNAYTLTSYGVRAIGLPGAGRWRREWAPLVGDASRLVTWMDADDAGRKGLAHIVETLRAAHGDAWVRARGRAYQLPAGEAGPLDANDLHRRGELHARIERAAWRA